MEKTQKSECKIEDQTIAFSGEKICEMESSHPILLPKELFPDKVLLAMREPLGLFFPNIYTVTCTVGRKIMELYPNATETQIIQLTTAGIDLDIRATIETLTPLQVLRQQCAGCGYSLRRSLSTRDITRVTERNRTSRICETVSGVSIPLPDHLFQNEIPRPIRDVLEHYYPLIYILVCALSRIARNVYSGASEGQVFEISRALMAVGIRATLEDIITRRIIENQCAGCYHPYRDPTVIEEVDSKEEYPPEIPPKSINSNLSLADQLLKFIEEMGGETGVPLSEINAHFAAQGVPEDNIWSALMVHINQGTLYKPVPNKYKIL